MHMSLYQIQNELRSCEELLDEWAMDHEGDITDFPLSDELDKLEMDRERKALSVGVWIKNMTSQSKAIADEIKTLQARKKAYDNRAARLKEYLQESISTNEKFEDARCKLSWRKSTQVYVAPDVTPEDVEAVMPEAIKVKKEISKTLLKDYLKTNTPIALKTAKGYDTEIKMITNHNIQVK